MFDNLAKMFLAVLFSFATVNYANAQTRSYDGSGNNQANSQWGSAGSNYLRWGPVGYGDGLSTPGGSSRPNPRDISNLVGNQTGSMTDSRNLTSFAWQWGQFLDHDIALTPTHGTETHSIFVNDTNDPLYPIIPMARSNYDPATGMTTPRQQINANTSYIDASQVYGSNDSRAQALRTFSGGMMNTSAGNMLPYNTGLLPNANEGGENDADLFLAGDVRANEQSGLIAMHTVFMREHNRLATEIGANDSSLTDEQIYQHARSLVGGMIQSITYNEYLPAIMGNAAPSLSGAAYNPNVNATIANEFATAAFRMGHTQVADTLMRIQNDGSMAPGGHLPLRDAFFVPSRMSDSAEVDYLLNGLAHQIQQETDLLIIDDLRNMLFGPPGAGGLDLFSLNVQRGRDHGLSTYNEAAISFGLSAAGDFSDITSDVQLQMDLASLYSSVDELDLWVGLLAEDKDYDSEMGSLMGIMLHEQFANLMIGDSYFFLWDSNLSQMEVDMIMNTRLSDLISRNTSLTNLQGNLFFGVPEPSSSLVLLGILVATFSRRRRSNS